MDRQFYISANYHGDDERRESADRLADVLVEKGHRVVSTWHTQLRPTYIEYDHASRDLEELFKATDLVIIRDTPGVGKWIEYGFYLAIMYMEIINGRMNVRRIHVINPMDDMNVFSRIEGCDIVQHQTFNHFLDSLRWES